DEDEGQHHERDRESRSGDEREQAEATTPADGPDGEVGRGGEEQEGGDDHDRHDLADHLGGGEIAGAQGGEWPVEDEPEADGADHEGDRASPAGAPDLGSDG